MSGVLAAFADEAALEEATMRLSLVPACRLQTYTPRPLEDDPPRSRLPLVILLAGMLSAAAIFGMETYADTASYPLDIGGRPLFSWPSLVPMAFEGGALAAVAAGFFGFLIANRLPHLHDPVDESEGFRRATRDWYFLAIRAPDAAALAEALSILDELHPELVEELPA
ncbi:MAG: DUF3341 domain-containing protein [Acidisphaera sp.]|nr:DUF3341 domain-containing protein [Acidisphaera sp.]